MKELPSGTLVIIGNGFDLSHGLKTSYNDFFKHYILESLRKAMNSGRSKMYEDCLFRIGCNQGEYVFNQDFDRLKELNLKDLKKEIEEKIHYMSIVCIGGDFSESLYTSFDKWVDIENTYYEHLRSYVKMAFQDYPNQGGSQLTYTQEKIQKLNDQMSFLTKTLNDYLSESCNQTQKIRNLNSDFFIEHYEDYFSKEKLREEYVGGNHHIHLLDFNYTNTSFMYAHHPRKGITINVNKIHGKLDSNEYPLIFGYGDERNNDYTLIEDIQLDEAFEKIKSFGYFNTGSYEDLLGFIDRGDFTVVILGHSCGLSDRVLLSTIFEHDNCKKIRVCFWGDPEGKNDFTSKTYQISRHFRDKIKMRERIIPFNPKDRIPQFND